MQKAAGAPEVTRIIDTSRVAFPLRWELSLAPLVRFWTERFAGDQGPTRALLGHIKGEIERYPELTGAISDCGTLSDCGVLGTHRDLLDLLMAVVFAPAAFELEYAAALVPFQLRSFYATDPARRFLLDDEGYLKGRVNLDGNVIDAARIFTAYKLILQRIYKLDVEAELPIIITVPDPDTGLDRHFKAAFDYRFIDVVPVGEPPALSDDALRGMRATLLDQEQLLATLPPDKFLFRGFALFRAADVTEQEVLSSIKRDLIDRESIVSTAKFQKLQTKVRTLLRRPEVNLGLAALAGDEVLFINYGADKKLNCIFADSAHRKTSEFAGTIYERAVRERVPVFIDDLAVKPDRMPIEDESLQAGIRNIVVAPLIYQDTVIGTLGLKSPNVGDVDSGHLPLLGEVLPLFAMAVQRSVEELDNRIQAFIKAKATAIHPSVDWRFRQAALRTMDRRRAGGLDVHLDMEPIVFSDVYPLYALSDIRSSSTLRAEAIQADLRSQLQIAHDVVQAAHAAKALPALHELIYRIGQYRTAIEGGLNTGDEVGVIAFLRKEVEALFGHLETFGPTVRDRVEAYRAALDSRIGVVYVERRRFEESVAQLSDALSAYIDLEEGAAQEMYPHYFEKQQTDGVDYQIYVGASLKEDGAWDPIYLKNLRIWQLMVTCGAARRAHQLRDTLPLPLETTHLILLQHTPLSIRFRFDEKRFDVDGAYDIRYAIVKKRIDKALINNTTERLTQPGKIAIVYSQPSEAQEYRRYLDYLQSLGYLKPGIEDVELEELQGVHGLRALRVAVDLTRPEIDQPRALSELAQRAG
ncbi:MAG TPA: GAF domain-containing protein [Candidatus Acidoferrum sp.]|nr:GAF domain-containing protein [Candidatus Acidoferrum sp.]